jgi:hypothetical protein
MADEGSIDNTRAIGEKYNAVIIDNPEVLHEPGKALASWLPIACLILTCIIAKESTLFLLGIKIALGRY